MLILLEKAEYPWLYMLSFGSLSKELDQKEKQKN